MAKVNKVKLNNTDYDIGGGDDQIQSDWNETDTTDPAYIKNKPTIPDAQIQSDWNQTSSSAKDYIKNKPTIPAETPIATTSIAGKVKPDGTTITVDSDGTIHSQGGSGEQVQSDWDETDDTEPSYIQNKPDIAEVSIVGDTLVIDGENVDAQNSSGGHSYSTDEQVIGTWIDGKPIYRKVLTFTPDSKNYTYTHNIPIDSIVSFRATKSGASLPVLFVSTTEALLQNSIGCWITQSVVRLLVGSIQTIGDVTCIVEYTKTTD